MKTPHPDAVDIEQTPGGFHLHHNGERQWFRHDGQLTGKFHERGIWASVREADLQRAQFCSACWPKPI